MKIVAISDTHSLHDTVDVPECEVLIHAGDLTGNGSRGHALDFLSWFSKQPGQHKLYIPGNHDHVLKEEKFLKEAITQYPHIVNLHNKSHYIDGVSFYGSAITPRFGHWSFMKDRGASIKEEWDKIPKDVDVLVTHGPPHGVLDLTVQGDRAGCLDLLDAILRIEPSVHISGHIHEGYGRSQLHITDCYNVSICTVRYKPTNPVTIINL